MNPSVADLTVDDPTVRKECGFARSWGFGGLVKANVMDYRATHPRDLLKPGVCPVSGDNLAAIAGALTRVTQVVVAWGRLHVALRVHADAVEKLLHKSNLPIFCLGRNQDGSPKHPLYLKSSTMLEPYNPRSTT